MPSIGERLRNAREQRGWTQALVARKLIAAGAQAEPASLERKLGLWENDGSGVGPRNQRLLAAVFDCAPTDLGFGSWSHAVSAAPVPAVEDDVMAMRAFRAADRQMGGAHLYASVRRYLHTEVAPRLVGGTGHDGPALFTGAAGLTEMAGWMAHDAGQDDAARQHFERSLDLARLGGDSQLSAHVLGSLSHLAHHLDRPSDAIRFARQGQDMLGKGPPHPGLTARLLSMQARGHAATGRVKACGDALARAGSALGESFAYEPSPWVSHFDEGSLASEAARCMHRLGDVGEARRQAERILELRPPGRARSRAFGQLALVSALIAEGHPDEACAVARDVVDATGSLGSFIVIAQLQELALALEPWRSNETVKDFLACLEQTLRERLWLSQWLGTTDLATA